MSWGDPNDGTPNPGDLGYDPGADPTNPDYLLYQQQEL